VLGFGESNLSVYLNDHLAGSTAGLNLARRLAKEDRPPVLGTIAREIKEDRATLLALMRALDVGEDRAKVALSWATEKASRLRFQEERLGYFEELETLSLGVEGKQALWTALQRSHHDDPRLTAFDLAMLAERARSQRRRLEDLRLRSASDVLT
jgi:hypothetical protein